MMIKLCVFDLDGTVANTLDSIAHFANHALKKYGFKEFPTESYRYFVGDGADALIRRITEQSGGSQNDYENIKNEYMTTYNNNCTYLTKCYDGILDMLAALKAMNIKNIILSNKPQIQAENVSKSLFGDELIDGCFGGKEGVPLKPDPTVLNEIIKNYGFEKSECLFIGDTKTDMMTAKNGGIKSVGVLWGFRNEAELKAHNADFIVSAPLQIVELIKSY